MLILNLSTFNFSDKALGLECSARIHFRTTLVQSTVYINDLPSVCPEVEIELYADNIVIYTHGTSKQQAEEKLIKALNGIRTWLNMSCLKLNTSKTVGLFFSKKSKTSPDPDITLMGENLLIINKHKYLGI